MSPAITLKKRMTPERKLEIVCREIRACGQYWRNDWSDFDGRTLRGQLEALALWAESDDQEEFTDESDALKEQEEGYR